MVFEYFHHRFDWTFKPGEFVAGYRIFAVNGKTDVIRILHGGYLAFIVISAVEVNFEVFNVVVLTSFLEFLVQIAYRIVYRDNVRLRISFAFIVRGVVAAHAAHNRRIVGVTFRYRYRVVGKRVALNVVDIIPESVGEGQNERDADDADAPCERNEDSSRHFRQHIFETERKRGEKTHRSFLCFSLLGGF